MWVCAMNAYIDNIQKVGREWHGICYGIYKTMGTAQNPKHNVRVRLSSLTKLEDLHWKAESHIAPATFTRAESVLYSGVQEIWIHPHVREWRLKDKILTNTCDIPVDQVAQQWLALADFGIAPKAPKNNDGRKECFWCKVPTKSVCGFSYNTVYNVCTQCGR